MGDRQFNDLDKRYLSSMRANMEDERFQKMYFKERDVWERMFPTGALPNATIHRVIRDYEDMIDREKAATLAAKSVKKPEKVA